MNATLLNILKMRSSLFQSASLQNDGLQVLSGLVTDNPTVEKVGSILDGMGNGLSYRLKTDGTLSVIQDVKDGIQEQHEIFDGTISDWNDKIDDILLAKVGGSIDGSTDIKSFLQDASRGQQSNLLLSTALDKFSTNSKCNSQDLISLVDSFGVQSADKKQLKQAIAAASDAEGKISNFSFLNIVQNIANNAKDSLDEGQITMDTTHIFYLTNFLATAWDTIISVIGTIIGTLLTMVNQLVGLIVTAVTWIVSTIVGAINKSIPSKIVVLDPLSTTDWFEGPIAANFINIENNGSIHGLDSDQVNLYSDGVIDHCLWRSSSGNIAINRFLGCGLDLQRAANYLSNLLQITRTRDNSDYIYTIDCSVVQYWANPAHWPDDCYLDTDEQADVLNKSTDDLNKYIASCYYLQQGLLVAQYFYQHKNELINATLHVKVAQNWADEQVLFDAAVEAANQGKGFTHHLCNYLYWYYTKGSDSQVRNPGDTVLTTLAQLESKLSKTVLEDGQNVFKSKISSQTMYWTSGSIAYAVEFSGDSIDFVCPTDDICRFIDRESNYFNTSYTANEQLIETYLSCIPTDRMFRFAAYDQQALIKAMVTIGTVTAIALVAGTVIVKQIKKMSFRRQLQRKNDLINLSSAYADNPTQENYNALYKAQKSYNFKAKLFGWDTYDAGNQWFDVPEAQGNDGGLNIKGSELTLEDIKKLIL